MISQIGCRLHLDELGSDNFLPYMAMAPNLHGFLIQLSDLVRFVGWEFPGSKWLGRFVHTENETISPDELDTIL